MYTILATETSAELSELLNPIMTSITQAVSTTDIVSLVGKAVAFGIPFFLAWMGIRKLVDIATSAVRSGSIQV